MKTSSCSTTGAGPPELTDHEALYARYRAEEKRRGRGACHLFPTGWSKVGQKRGRGGFAATPNILKILVAGAGFEPATFVTNPNAEGQA